MPRIRLIHWKPSEVEQRVSALRAAGFETDYEAFTMAVLRRMRTQPPDAVVIDLSRLPSQGRDVAMAIRGFAPLRRTPIVFAGGDPERVKQFERQLPDAVFSSWGHIRAAVTRAIAHPPTTPTVPRSSLAGYAGTPLPKKLGMKAGHTVALVGAPRDFGKTLGTLPKGVVLRRRRGTKADLTIWFTRSLADLTTGVARIAEVAGDNLWIAWPKKTSAIAADLTQAEVRRAGLGAGLVDYKVCAIDETWSGLKFTRRKNTKGPR